MRSAFVATATYAGMPSDSPTVRMVRAWSERMPVGFAPLANCAVIGWARAELVTWFMNPRECFRRMCSDRAREYAPHDLASYDTLVFLDDDVTLEREGDLDRLLGMLDAGAEVVSAPVRDRHGTGLCTFVSKRSGPSTVGGERVVELAATGFGCVAIRRQVIERMIAKHDELRCRSTAFHGLKTWAMFDSFVAPADEVGLGDGDDTPMHFDDDYGWSIRARRLGVRLFAAIDVPTLHRGIRCAMGEEFDKHRERAR